MSDSHATLPDGATIPLASLASMWQGNWNSLRGGGYVTWDITLRRDAANLFFVAISTTLPWGSIAHVAEQSTTDVATMEKVFIRVAERAGLDGYREAWIAGMAESVARPG